LKPYFSIIIPTYNRRDTLKITLDSVIAQTFADFEVLVMDDGSTDDTEAIVGSFLDPRIRYEWAPNSGGPATPRNRGIEAARADWICFLDSDDRWHKEKLKKVAETIAANPGLDLIGHNEMWTVLASGNKKPVNYGPFEPRFYEVMLRLGNRVSTSSACVRRAFLNEHDLRFNQSPDYVIVEDFDLWLRIALHGGVFHFIEDYYTEWIVADTNISSNSEKLEHNLSVLLRDHVFGVQQFQRNRERLWHEISAGLFISKSMTQIRQKRYFDGGRFLVIALRRSLVGSLRYIVSKARERMVRHRRDGAARMHQLWKA
jgi:glycosyltransferase involved in cell wall biosynthesis